jgi:hypothetical protein
MKMHADVGFSRFARTCSVAVAALSIAAGAFAADVKLANGSIWKGDVGARVRATYMMGSRETSVEGTVVKIDKSLVVIEVDDGGKKTRRTILSLDLKKMETLAAASDAPAAPGATATPGSTASRSATPAAATASSKVPNIFVLPLEGTVGIGTRHEEIEEIGKEADKYGPGQIIVLLIDSPGGLVIEGDKIHETMKDLKKRHRVVAWIKKAISAAAFTSLHCDEIYFMRVGALGAITMFAGQTSITGKELDAWLEKVGEACEIGGRSPWIGHAMVTNAPLLSYDRDEDGNVTWYNTMQGKYKLSDEKQNLTLNAENALHSGFSDGTADTVEELAVCLQLKEWKEASDVGRRIHENWQRTLKQCAEVKPKLLNDLQNPGGLDAAAQIGNQIKALTEILKWYDKCYPGMVYEAPNLPPDKAPLERQLADFKKQLADIKRRQR